MAFSNISESEKMKAIDIAVISNDDYNNNEIFKTAIENDLNTSMMLTCVYDVLKSDLNGASKLYLIEKFDDVLSLDLLKDDVKESSLSDEIIMSKIEERDIAKKNKNFVLADEIRDELLSLGIKLIDTKEGTKYEII